jgi:SAM-dependent methyltransferase
MTTDSTRSPSSARYLRFHLFRALMDPFSANRRSGRMRAFAQHIDVKPGTNVLDLGGQPGIWQLTPLPSLNITILNLPGIAQPAEHSHHRITYVEGDGCRVDAYRDKTFDCVFSNSVIEHVGDAGQRAAFASEVRRLGRSYWVQTPAKAFPIEAHNGMPFWWFYPESLRRHFLRRWRAKLPDWTHMVETTTIVSRDELVRLFPEARIITERVMGIPKSYIACFGGHR